MKKNFSYCFFNNKFTNIENAKVSIMTNALQYGTGIFGGIRGYYNKNTNSIFIFRLEDHYKRFLKSLKILGVKIDYQLSQLKEITVELVEKNQPKTDCYFRPFAYAGSTSISPNLAENNHFDFSLYMIPLGDYLSTSNGIKAKISTWRRVTDNSIPARAKISGAYINSSLAKKEALDNGFDEAIVLKENGEVSEASAANLFIVKDGVLITTEKADDILEGITRKTIIQLANDLKIPVEERRIDKTELYTADEVFFCGTGVQISWVEEIDKRLIGDGKRGTITGKIQDMFFKIVRGEDNNYSSKWCTEVKIKK